MSDNRSGTTASVTLALGIVAGIAFMGWINKPAPVAVAAPAPVAAIDYSRITEAVRAGFPAPVAAPAPVKRKVHKVQRAPARVVYVVPAYHGCTCRL